jgi:hypothetical protein
VSVLTWQTKYNWWKFLLESRAKPVDRAALAEGLDPTKLYTHNTVVPEGMEVLEQTFGLRVYTAEDYKKPFAFLALEQNRAEDASDSESDSDSSEHASLTSPPDIMHHSAPGMLRN